MKHLLFILLAGLFLVTACKKKDPTPASSSSFSIKFKATLGAYCTLQGMSVKIYKTEQDYYANNNALYTGVTDSNEECIISNIPVANYYYRISKPCGTSFMENCQKHQITGSITAGSQYYEEVLICVL